VFILSFFDEDVNLEAILERSLKGEYDLGEDGSSSIGDRREYDSGLTSSGDTVSSFSSVRSTLSEPLNTEEGSSAIHGHRMNMIMNGSEAAKSIICA
jgi:hypothetical protein